MKGLSSMSDLFGYESVQNWTGYPLCAQHNPCCWCGLQIERPAVRDGLPASALPELRDARFHEQLMVNLSFLEKELKLLPILPISN